MCLIVYKPSSENLDYDILRRAHRDNPHGCGYLVRIDGKLYAEKGLWSFKRLKRKLRGLTRYELAVHFRFATHGPVVKENCHPFHGKQWSMVHNGIVQGFGSLHQSDTA